MRRGIPCRTLRGWDKSLSRRGVSMGQRKVQPEIADGGRHGAHGVCPSPDTTRVVCANFSVADSDGFRRDTHVDIRREAHFKSVPHRCESWPVCQQNLSLANKRNQPDSDPSDPTSRAEGNQPGPKQRGLEAEASVSNARSSRADRRSSGSSPRRSGAVRDMTHTALKFGLRQLTSRKSPQRNTA